MYIVSFWLKTDLIITSGMLTNVSIS
jgi:hypothetical protein